jgi:hypothetical protein
MVETDKVCGKMLACQYIKPDVCENRALTFENKMEQSPCRDADSCSGSQSFRGFIGAPTFSVVKAPSLDPTYSHLNSFYTPIFHCWLVVYLTTLFQ